MRGTIDREEGIIHGVSIATIGEARGHGLFFDDQTLAAIKALADKKLKGVKIKWTHEARGMSDWIGNARNLRIEGDQLLGDIYVFDATPHRELFLEVAEQNPEDFGVSVHIEQEVDGNLVRPIRLHSADIVESPAANPRGLFSEIKPKTENEGIDNLNTQSENVIENQGQSLNQEPTDTMTKEDIEAIVATAVAAATEPLMAQMKEYADKVDAMNAETETEGEDEETPAPEVNVFDAAAFEFKIADHFKKLEAKFEALHVGPAAGAAEGEGADQGPKTMSEAVKKFEAEGLKRTEAISKAVNAYPALYEEARKKGIKF